MANNKNTKIIKKISLCPKIKINIINEKIINISEVIYNNEATELFAILSIL
jgi:hypothetical protein